MAQLEVSATAAEETASTPPMGLKVIFREFTKDKLALGSFILLCLILLFVFGMSFFIDTADATLTDISVNLPPGTRVMNMETKMAEGVPLDDEEIVTSFFREDHTYILGSDEGGRDVFGILVIGARNSILIGWSVTIITSIVAIIVGLIAAYYAGLVDNIIMRIIDFIMILPSTMIIIMFITIISDYNIYSFIAIMCLFGWHGQARFIRGRALTIGQLDFISASKTMGTPTWKIVLNEMLPNVSSLILVNLILSFAGSIGLETGLTFLGFGLPNHIPSLGTLINSATSPTVLRYRPWVWLPAALTILVMVLCINYVGQALQRAADAKQRLG